VPSSSEKLERLLNLTAALLETPRPLSAMDIARRVYGYPEEKSAFRRAFERDKEDLREMGVPLVMSEISGTDPPEIGYRIPKDQYYLRDPGLEPDELAALHLAASTVRLDGIEGAGGLWKLGGRPATPAPADRGPEVTPIPVDKRLVVLFDAVAERKPVTFTYNDTERTVDPYRLDFQRDHWYVSGFDHVRGEERNFRVDRIEGDVASGARRSFE
jgi:predicted DNA-binding transcriptional regulator YafY